MADSVESTRRLQVTGLVKRFRGKEAVAGVDFSIGSGELVGLIGPNGAGKSTTVKMITGQLLADEGAILIGGQNLRQEPTAARRLTGYVPQDVVLYPFLTGREVLQFVAKVHELSDEVAGTRIDGLLARFQLVGSQHKMTREYSEGMARKLAIAVALMGEPQLVVLDESLNGLDPRAAAEVKAIVREQVEAGKSVLWISHMLEVVERLATRVVAMDQGKIVGEWSRSELDAELSAGKTLEDLFLEHTATETA